MSAMLSYAMQIVMLIGIASFLDLSITTHSSGVSCIVLQSFCFWGEHSKGLGNQADVDMINAISAADIAFIMSSSQAIMNWLNALDQSDFS